MPNAQLEVPNFAKGLFLSSSGGHFSELVYILRKFNANSDSHIITFASPDTSTLNIPLNISHVPYVAPRKLFPILSMYPRVNSIARGQNFEYVASTGAAIALVAYAVALRRRLPFFYIESIARQSSLSLTAKILRFLGVKRFFVQSENLVNRNRKLISHPIENFKLIEKIDSTPLSSFKIFIALGTIEGYEFKRAIELVKPLLGEFDKVEWQFGYTKYEDLPGRLNIKLDRTEFLELIKESDVIICHAGIGIITDCFEANKKPIVVPRRSKYSEHVDDHQVEILKYLLAKKLVFNLEDFQDRRILEEAIRFKVVNK